MSKAEEMAWLAFPEDVVIDSSGESSGVDFNLLPRNCFRKGYEQAEKDLILKAVKWLKERGANKLQISMFVRDMEDEK